MIYIIDNLLEYLYYPIFKFLRNRNKNYNKVMQFLAGIDCILNSLVLWVWLIDDDDYSDFEYIHFCLFRGLNGLDSDVEDYYGHHR